MSTLQCDVFSGMELGGGGRESVKRKSLNFFLFGVSRFFFGRVWKIKLENVWYASYAFFAARPTPKKRKQSYERGSERHHHVATRVNSSRPFVQACAAAACRSIQFFGFMCLSACSSDNHALLAMLSERSV